MSIAPYDRQIHAITSHLDAMLPDDETAFKVYCEKRGISLE